MSNFKQSQKKYITILDQFSQAASSFPDKLAVQDFNCAYTYEELSYRANIVCSNLRSVGVKQDDIVAVKLDPSCSLIEVLIGILMVGATYLPLDSKSPDSRNLLILNDAKPVAIICNDSNTPVGTWMNISLNSCTKPCIITTELPHNNLDRFAYVIYTSGTTGIPKGVPVSHRNIAALFSSTEDYFKFSDLDSILLFHSYAFDFSVWEIWSALAFGGRLVIPKIKERINPERIANIISKEKITVLNQTPSAFFVNSPKLITLKNNSLRHIIFGGERLNFKNLRKWAENFGLEKPILTNMYGITEITVHATIHKVTPYDLTTTDSIIGNVLPGFSYTIREIDDLSLDEDGGELLLEGPQVTTGYYNRDEITREKFLPTNKMNQFVYCSGDIVNKDPQGRLVYIGRVDKQVKMYGYRIEISEIESALAEPYLVTDITVLATASDFIGKYLLCCFTSDKDEKVITSKLRELAKQRLPLYMRPLMYNQLKSIPRTINGKIDTTAILHQHHN